MEPGVTQGNCFDLFDQLPESPELIVCDPPYNYGIEYEAVADKMKPAHYLQWSKNWMRLAYNALSPAGSFWLIIADEWQPELTVAAKELGFTWRNTVVWYYTFGVHCEKKFSRSHTMLVYFTKHKKRYTFNREAILQPSARQTKYGDKRAASAGRTPDDLWICHPDQVPDSFKADEDTWHVPRVNGTFKERQADARTQLPELLLQRIILATSNPGDMVLDPMCGTGTTPCVAKALGRRGYGFELGPETAKKAQERYERVTAG